MVEQKQPAAESLYIDPNGCRISLVSRTSSERTRHSRRRSTKYRASSCGKGDERRDADVMTEPLRGQPGKTTVWRFTILDVQTVHSGSSIGDGCEMLA